MIFIIRILKSDVNYIWLQGQGPGLFFKQAVTFCGWGTGMSQSNETMADGLSVRALEKVRPVGGPVNWRTTKDKTEMKNSESGQTTGFYNDKNFRNWLG